MKKTLTTVVLLLLTTFSASAQIYRAGGIGGFGTNTSYGSRSGGSGVGNSGSSSSRWFASVGGIYNTLHSEDVDVINGYGGIGAIIEVGKGTNSLAVEYLTHSYDEANSDATIGDTKIELVQTRAYIKRRQYFTNFMYLHGGAGIINYNLKATPPSSVGAITFDESTTDFLINFGLGLDINLGGFGFFIESGIVSLGSEGATLSVGGASVAQGTNSSTVHFDGIRGGFKFLF